MLLWLWLSLFWFCCGCGCGCCYGGCGGCFLSQFDRPLYAEELYDHRGDKESDLGKKELVNLAGDPMYQEVVKYHRSQLLSFLYNEVVYVNISSTFMGMEYGGGKGNKRKKGSFG